MQPSAAQRVATCFAAALALLWEISHVKPSKHWQLQSGCEAGFAEGKTATSCAPEGRIRVISGFYRAKTKAIRINSAKRYITSYFRRISLHSRTLSFQIFFFTQKITKILYSAALCKSFLIRIHPHRSHDTKPRNPTPHQHHHPGIQLRKIH